MSTINFTHIIPARQMTFFAEPEHSNRMAKAATDELVRRSQAQDSSFTPKDVATVFERNYENLDSVVCVTVTLL